MPRNKKKGIGFFDLMLGAPFPQSRSQERQQQAAQPPYFYYPSPQEQQQPVYTYTIPENNSNPPPRKEKKVRFADNLVQYSDEEPKGYASSTAAQDSEPDSGENISITIKRSSGGKYTMTKGNAQVKEATARSRGKGKGDDGKAKENRKYAASKAEKKRRIKKALEYLISSDSEASFSSDEDESTSESEQEDDEVVRNNGAAEKARATTQEAAVKEKEASEPLNEDDYEEQRAYSKNHFYRHVLREQYPDRLKIKPDKAFSADDCAILANLEARQHALRYHHLQAEFCNATGRMLPLDFIKAKVESSRPRLSS